MMTEERDDARWVRIREQERGPANETNKTEERKAHKTRPKSIYKVIKVYWTA